MSVHVHPVQPLRPVQFGARFRGLKLAIEGWRLLALPVLICCLAVTALALVIGAENSPDGDTPLHFAAAVALLAIAVVSVVAHRFRERGKPDGATAESAFDDIAPVLQLLRDKESAEAANAAKSRHLVSVSHEILSPLNAIYGYAQLVERGDGVSPKEAARVIRRSTEHLTSLVEGLLDISLVENGVLSLESDTVRLVAFLDQIASMFRPSAVAKGLKFNYELSGRLPESVRMDQKRVRQILINLLSNAIKFTAAGSVTLRVSYAAQIAVFEITDTGPGIAPEDRDAVFDRFERGGDAKAHVQPGFGLGLSITRALVQILGGNLEMESEVGSGTRFRVTLMLSHVAGQMTEAAPACRVTGYEGQRRSILVVDDDIQQLALMRHLLESLGFDIATAPNGETAIDLCRAAPFDLVILDVSMPGLSGWETAGRLRSQWGSSLHIVMLSANALEARQPDVETRVHDLFIAKPFEIEAVIDAIGAQLDLRWLRDVPGESAPRTDTAFDQPLMLPDAALVHVERLGDLLRIGHVRGIEAEIEKFAAAAPDAHAVVARLYDCLDHFDLSALSKMLENMSDGRLN
ncbi:MAG: ATP-binding protein [Sphingomonas bacterium]